MRRQPATVLAFFALWSFACGEGRKDCLTLLQEYAVEDDNALLCDPTVPSPCSVARPVVVALQDGTGVTPEALASNCTHSMNPARVARLDQILLEYQAAHCKVVPVPVCLPPVDLCREFPPGTGRFACAG